MLLKITLWGLLIGSIITGIFGIHTGSATTTVIGIASVFFVDFLLYFLAQMSIDLLLTFLKVLVIVVVIGAVVLLSIRGCKMMIQKTEDTSRALVEKSAQFIADHRKSSLVSTKSERVPDEIGTAPYVPDLKSEPVVDEIGTAPYVPHLKEETQSSFFAKVKAYITGRKDKEPIPMNRNVILDPISQDNALSQNQSLQLNGVVTDVLSGNVFKMNHAFVKLYGLDVPSLKQPCVDKRGASYSCGRMAKQRLERLILQKRIKCQIVSRYAADQLVATCVLKGYDVGASMVAVGWALADRRVTDVYIPYEQEARHQHLGLWSGKFMAPWVYRQKTIGASNGTQSKKGFFESLFQ